MPKDLHQSQQENQSEGVTEPSEADFKKELESHPGVLVVVDFHATWCGPCKMIAPKVIELEDSHKIFLLKVDVDECEEVAKSCNIKAMPTFHLYKDGKKVSECMGANITALIREIEEWQK